MIAANGVTARYLSSRKFPSLRRVVRTPKRWDGIVEVARRHGFKLPAQPDLKTVGGVLLTQRRQPIRCGSPTSRWRSLKLHGARPVCGRLSGGLRPPGHFGLAVGDYAHSTAPNRRYPDIITQRLLKAAWPGNPHPTAKNWRSWRNTARRRGCGRESGAAGREVGGGDALGVENRGTVRCDCHRCSRQGHMGPSPGSSRRRKTGARHQGIDVEQDLRTTDAHGRGAGVHRLRERWGDRHENYRIRRTSAGACRTRKSLVAGSSEESPAGKRRSSAGA